MSKVGVGEIMLRIRIRRTYYE